MKRGTTLRKRTKRKETCEMDDFLGGCFSRVMVRPCRYTRSSESQGSLHSSTIEEQKSNTFFPNVADNIKVPEIMHRGTEKKNRQLIETLKQTIMALVYGITVVGSREQLKRRKHGATTTDVHSVAISSRLDVIRFSTRLVSVAEDSEDETTILVEHAGYTYISSVQLMKDESEKLLERATFAENRMTKGYGFVKRDMLIKLRKTTHGSS
uniref:Uncharacterized protein n=1 Tax=Tanacetum cinerariifolium TaxID=118510 RepID=A0A699H293_TANCI|nr:hypothetical protein [Tanacetum cinerariifolium]